MADRMTPRIPMKTRNVRAPDKLWDAAHAAAVQRGENLSEEIRKFLERYIKGDK